MNRYSNEGHYIIIYQCYEIMIKTVKNKIYTNMYFGHKAYFIALLGFDFLYLFNIYIIK